MTEKRKKIYKVFNTIQPTNTYPGWLHNNLKLYRAIRHNHPESKIIERMFMEGHLNLFAMKRKWIIITFLTIIHNIHVFTNLNITD